MWLASSFFPALATRNSVRLVLSLHHRGIVIIVSHRNSSTLGVSGLSYSVRGDTCPGLSASRRENRGFAMYIVCTVGKRRSPVTRDRSVP